MATINESCGIESDPITNSNIWMFHAASVMTTDEPPMETTITQEYVYTETTSTAVIHSACSRWLHFNTISNESTSNDDPTFLFCFTINTTSADVTIAANTWVPCATWKFSGAADPLLELYSLPNRQLLARNDDGNSLPFKNCYAAVLSYRLPMGNYQVTIRNPKCAHGNFELRVLTETFIEQK